MGVAGEGPDMSALRRKDTPAQGGVDKRRLFQNNAGLISFSVEKVEEEKVEKEVKAKERTSGNILVVETDFERMPRRSSFRSKERRELTRGASIQFDEKPANVIVTTGGESDTKEDEEESEKESTNSEELNEMARLSLGEGVGLKLRRNSLDRVPLRRKSSTAGKEGM